MLLDIRRLVDSQPVPTAVKEIYGTRLIHESRINFQRTKNFVTKIFYSGLSRKYYFQADSDWRSPTIQNTK